ncbi:helix-turn-helix domain-containing protein [Micromonospora sp. NBC_01638]|uniref:AraC-like ligand-binding domain-containing protein n=1 Tax=Micromonospora sp. NBC_01638 TaxID=2975982 RepID=UPI00386EADBF|nr:helix-turn-helix domain-containing protein [Micromonospora sp. NBC_01638]
MRESRFSTDDLPTADRWSSWNEFSTDTYYSTRMRTHDPENFQGSMRMLDLGPIKVSTLNYNPLEVFRTPKLIRQSDPGVHQLVLPLRGQIGVSQAGRESSVDSRALILYDPSRPFHSWTATTRGPDVSCMVVLIPKKLIALRAQVLEPLNATPLPARRGLTALLRRHLIGLQSNAVSWTAADAARLGTITLDLIAATYAHELEATSVLPPETHRQALQTRIHDFIQQRLRDPGLTPGTIAAAHAVSTRHLHTIFQQQGLTVAAFIRQQRLERCRHDLADPRHRHRPIHAIAHQWGFTSAAHFTRLFHATYGRTPGDHRHAAGCALRPGTGPGSVRITAPSNVRR